MPKHAGWAAAQSGKEAWIIDNGMPEEKWFLYNPASITQMRYVRKNYCEKLREGNTL